MHLDKINKWQFGLFFFSIWVLFSCDKTDIPRPVGKAGMAIVHASPFTPAVDVFIDGVKITSAPLAYAQATGFAGNPYDTVSSGNPNVKISGAGNTFVDAFSILSRDSAYTIFLHDTLGGVGKGRIRSLQLNDNLSVPGAGFSKIRFLPLSPDAPPMTVDFFYGTDSLRISDSVTYVGGTSDIYFLSQFGYIAAADYRVKVKLPSIGNAVVIDISRLSLLQGKIYTLYVTGLARLNLGGSGTDVNALRGALVRHN